MKTNDRTRTATAAVGCGLLALAASLPSVAAAESASTDWNWAATVYLWLPSLGGETSFPPAGNGPSVDVSVDQILDSLNFAFMGAFEGRKERWGLATDVIYLDLGASKKNTRDLTLGQVELPASVTADARLDLSGWLWTTTGSYEVLPDDRFSLNVLGGARMLDLEQQFHWELTGDLSSLPVTGPSGSRVAKGTQWDAIVGVKGRAALGSGDAWFVPYYLDVGTGESDLTWQAMLGLGYRFGAVEVLGVWRYLDYEFADTPMQSLDLTGGALGVTFRF